MIDIGCLVFTHELHLVKNLVKPLTFLLSGRKVINTLAG